MSTSDKTTAINKEEVNRSPVSSNLTASPAPSTQKFWVNDTSLSTIADLISNQLKEDKQNAPQEEHPQESADQQSPHQHLRINLIRHRTAVSDLKTLQLFKSLALTLRKVDPLLVILPYKASKQHYSALTNNKQIESLNENRLYQYFRPYYQKQNYSLSGYPP
jgi:hypothetical protein